MKDNEEETNEEINDEKIFSVLEEDDVDKKLEDTEKNNYLLHFICAISLSYKKMNVWKQLFLQQKNYSILIVGFLRNRNRNKTFNLKIKTKNDVLF